MVPRSPAPAQPHDPYEPCPTCDSRNPNREEIIEFVKGLRRRREAALRLPPLADPVYPRPALIWRLDNGGPTDQQLELSYATAGLSWTAEYVGVLDAAGKTAELTAWIAMVNQSGTAYADASIALIAGDVRRMKVPERPMLGMTMRAMTRQRGHVPA